MELTGGDEISQFSGEIGWLAYALSTFKDVLIEIGEYVLETIEEQFDSGGMRIGGWQYLEDRTIELKGHDDILVDTGLYRDSWDFPFTAINEITIRSDEQEKVLAHQFGYYHNWSDQWIPDRPALVVLTQDVEQIGDIFDGKIDHNLGLVFTD